MLARVASRFGIHYGWLVVFVIFLVLLFSAGIRNIPGLIVIPLEQEFGWTRSAISFAIGISILMYGLGGPFSGRLIGRFGPMRLLVGALTISALGTAALFYLQNIVQLTLVWGVLVGITTGVLGMPLGAALAARWFVSRRGMVTGIIGAGSSAGALIFIPLMNSILDAAGWRAAILIGSLLLLALVPLVLLIVRDSPTQRRRAGVRRRERPGR